MKWMFGLVESIHISQNEGVMWAYENSVHVSENEGVTWTELGDFLDPKVPGTALGYFTNPYVDIGVVFGYEEGLFLSKVYF